LALTSKSFFAVVRKAAPNMEVDLFISDLIVYCTCPYEPGPTCA